MKTQYIQGSYRICYRGYLLTSSTVLFYLSYDRVTRFNLNLHRKRKNVKQIYFSNKDLISPNKYMLPSTTRQSFSFAFDLKFSIYEPGLFRSKAKENDCLVV